MSRRRAIPACGIHGHAVWNIMNRTRERLSIIRIRDFRLDRPENEIPRPHRCRGHGSVQVSERGRPLYRTQEITRVRSLHASDLTRPPGPRDSVKKILESAMKS